MKITSIRLLMFIIFLSMPRMAVGQEEFIGPVDSIGQLNAFKTAEELDQERINKKLGGYGIIPHTEPLKPQSTDPLLKQPAVTDPTKTVPQSSTNIAPVPEPRKKRVLLDKGQRVNGFAVENPLRKVFRDEATNLSAKELFHKRSSRQLSPQATGAILAPEKTWDQ